MCHGEEHLNFVLFIPFVKDAALCVNCFYTHFVNCDECIRLVFVFVKMVVAQGLHPTRTSIRRILKHDILACMTQPWKLHLETHCVPEFQASWQLQFYDHLVEAHRPPQRDTVCDICTAPNTSACNLKKCMRCFFVKCVDCFALSICELCRCIQCSNCILTCSDCKRNVCAKDSWQCAQCFRALCKHCSNMMTCDLCRQLFCQDCQSTFQELDTHNTVCCFQCT